MAFQRLLHLQDLTMISASALGARSACQTGLVLPPAQQTANSTLLLKPFSHHFTTFISANLLCHRSISIPLNMHRGSLRAPEVRWILRVRKF